MIKAILMKFKAPLLTVAFLSVIPFSMKAQTMPLYLNFNSHNEISDNINYSSSSTWNQYRQIILTLADTFANNGVKWNLQAESDFIRANIAMENGYTNPNDLLDSLDNSPTVEVDPHNHFDNNPSSTTYNPFNYSDLAHLLDSTGCVYPRNNMGGFLWTVGSDFMPYQNPVQGNTYPTYYWNPQVIWGAGSPGHTNDYNGYGVWKPAGATMNFFTHTSSNHLTFIGNGCSNVVFDTTHVSTIVDQIVGTLQYIQYQPYNYMNMFTASIQMNFRDMDTPGYTDTIAAIVRALKPYVASGQIVYQTLTEKYITWYTAHTNTSDHFQLDCSGLHLGTDEVTTSSSVQLFPNPANAEVTIQASEPIEQAEIFDATGKLIYLKDYGSQEFAETFDASIWSASPPTAGTSSIPAW
jgi:hypothetical protein